MTVCDVLVQVMAELTGEPKTAIAAFIKELKKREPNKMLDQNISPEDAEELGTTLREGGEGPIADMVKETVEAFHSSKRDSH